MREIIGEKAKRGFVLGLGECCVSLRRIADFLVREKERERENSINVQFDCLQFFVDSSYCFPLIFVTNILDGT